jgi:GNAT superfamily N-acetyltransferase
MKFTPQVDQHERAFAGAAHPTFPSEIQWRVGSVGRSDGFMRFEWLDPADAETTEAVLDLWEAAHRVDYPRDPAFARADGRGRITCPSPSEPARFLLAHSGRELLAVAEIGTPLLDNTCTAVVELIVRPYARRRGVGTALWEQVAEHCLASGRKLVMTDTLLPGPGASFAQRLGAEPALRDVRRRLVVDAAARERATARAAAAAPAAAGYAVHSFLGPVPEVWLPGIAALMGRMSTDAPLQNLDWQPEVFDGARVREREAADAARGWRVFTTLAVRSDSGAVAGYTRIAVAEENPSAGWQHDTLVDPGHRGHRLGLLMKAANLAQVRARVPQLAEIITWNADDNRHMIAVNEAMGFEVFDSWVEWQLRL